MTTQANGKQVIGTVFGAVSDAAEAVSASFNTVTKSVGMANKFVADASTKQNLRSKIDMGTFRERLLDQAAMDETVRKQQIKEFCDSEDKQTLFSEAYSKFSALLD